jgi:hypothetical protein
MIITAGWQGEQLCWSGLWTRFSARTGAPGPFADFPAGSAARHPFSELGQRGYPGSLPQCGACRTAQSACAGRVPGWLRVLTEGGEARGWLRWFR